MPRIVELLRDAESGDWAVWCPELPGRASAGVSQEDALQNIKEAIELYLEGCPAPDNTVSKPARP